MQLERMNSWLRIGGQFAILAGLVALAIEIRGNTMALRSQELAALSDRQAARQLVMLDSEFRAIYVKSLYTPTDMTMNDLVAMNAYMSNRLSNLFNTYVAFQNGVLRASDWESRIVSAPMFLGTVFGKQYWEARKADFPDAPEFVAAVDNALANSPLVSDDKYLIELQKMMREAEE